VVHHIVELRTQGIDVLPVERRDERRVDLLVQVMGDLIAVVLHVGQAIAHRLHVGALQRQLIEQLRARHKILGGPGEEIEESALGGAKGEPHGADLDRRMAGGNLARMLRNGSPVDVSAYPRWEVVQATFTSC
jgi:hypothetical protein